MTIMSFVGSGSYKFSLRFEDKNVRSVIAVGKSFKKSLLHKMLVTL